MKSPIVQLVAGQTGLGAALNRESLSAWQMAKLQENLLFAQDHAPFYQKRLARCPIEGIRSPKDFAEAVPLMSAADLADPFDLLCVSPNQISRIVSLPTSGTYQQKRIMFLKEELEATAAFFAAGMSAFVGKGQRTAILMRGHEPDTVADLLCRGLASIGAKASICWPIDDFSAAAEQIKGSDCVVGFPAHVRMLACLYPSLRPSMVLLSADYVPQSLVDSIAALWQCKVVTHYGLTETGFGCGVQCLCAEGYHMRDADFLFEIINPLTLQPVPDGQEGEIVITTLARQAMPLIRYRTGDRASRIIGSCPCGGHLPRLSKVMGRMQAPLHLANGAMLTIEALDERLFGLPSLLDYRGRLSQKGDELVLAVFTQAKQYEALSIAIEQLLPEIVGLSLRFQNHPFPLETAKRKILTD